jgi:hypothetical protein
LPEHQTTNGVRSHPFSGEQGQAPSISVKELDNVLTQGLPFSLFKDDCPSAAKCE